MTATTTNSADYGGTPQPEVQPGVPPSVNHRISCGEVENRASLISSALVGATPAPATNFTSGPLAQGETNGVAMPSSGVATPPRLTAAQHNAFPKGRW